MHSLAAAWEKQIRQTARLQMARKVFDDSFLFGRKQLVHLRAVDCPSRHQARENHLRRE
jgi:hypothetical protein